MSLTTAKFAVLICATEEWKAILDAFPGERVDSSALGDWFMSTITVGETAENVIFFHGNWGKIAAAASTQYLIDKWSPQLLINLGTCGGFKGITKRGTIILVTQTIVYDMVDRMNGEGLEASYFTTNIDLSWVEGAYLPTVRRAPMLSADRDVAPEDIGYLRERFAAIAADWESGAIAAVATRNGIRCLILRGVSDLVGEDGGEAYEGNVRAYVEGTKEVISNLVGQLPSWLEIARTSIEVSATISQPSSSGFRIQRTSRQKR